jgi:predicted 3-demethylubiquinone-9 3-methyltransferase (glyoxalase superfamily)
MYAAARGETTTVPPLPGTAPVGYLCPHSSAENLTMANFRTRIAPCLWFDDQGEAAANFYVGIFPDSRITAIARYGEAGREIHHRPAGSVMTVAFELDGQPFTALNGGPIFKFNEAVSLQVFCADQREIDHYWDKLSAGGDPKAQQCGWLKDKFGLSWQIVPAVLPKLMSDPDPAKTGRALSALLKMKKLVIADLERAFAG